MNKRRNATKSAKEPAKKLRKKEYKNCEACHESKHNCGNNCGGGISCNACSRFFHRQVEKVESKTCRKLDECINNKMPSRNQCYATAKKDNIQKQCSYCRMNACLAIGMSPEIASRKRASPKSKVVLSTSTVCTNVAESGGSFSDCVGLSTQQNSREAEILTQSPLVYIVAEHDSSPVLEMNRTSLKRENTVVLGGFSTSRIDANISQIADPMEDICRVNTQRNSSGTQAALDNLVKKYVSDDTNNETSIDLSDDTSEISSLSNFSDETMNLLNKATEGLDLNQLLDSTVNSFQEVEVTIPISTTAQLNTLSVVSIDSNTVDIQTCGVEMKGEGIYPMNANHRGYCLILNEYEFSHYHYDTRHGSDLDVQKLSHVFTQLHFKVVVCNNQTKNEMVSTLEEYSKDESLLQHNAFVLIVLSHGDSGYIVTTDGLRLQFDDIVDRFNGQDSKLIDKPKLFFFGCCRGTARDIWKNRAIVEIDDAALLMNDSKSTSTDTELSNKVLNGDIMICYATIDGFVSYRNTKTGSWFVAALCESFMKYSHYMDLDHILKHTSMLLSNKISRYGEKQVMEHWFRNFKFLYFNPGIAEIPIKCERKPNDSRRNVMEKGSTRQQCEINTQNIFLVKDTSTTYTTVAGFTRKPNDSLWRMEEDSTSQLSEINTQNTFSVNDVSPSTSYATITDVENCVGVNGNQRKPNDSLCRMEEGGTSQLSEINTKNTFLNGLMKDSSCYTEVPDFEYCVAVNGNNRLFSNDYNCLNPRQFLSNTLVEYILKMMFSDSPNIEGSCMYANFVFVTPELHSFYHCYNAFRKPIVLLALCHENHFVLFILNVERKLISYLDALGEKEKDFQKYMDKFKIYLQNHNSLFENKLPLFDEWRVQTYQHQYQEDGFNCGVFAVHFCDQFLRTGDVNVDDNFDPNNYRRYLKLAILERSNSDTINRCLKCANDMKTNPLTITCFNCQRWLHATSCAKIDLKNYREGFKYYCPLCRANQ